MTLSRAETLKNRLDNGLFDLNDELQQRHMRRIGRGGNDGESCADRNEDDDEEKDDDLEFLIIEARRWGIPLPSKLPNKFEEL